MQARHTETNTARRQFARTPARTTQRSPQKTKEKPVEFILEMPNASSVAVAGTFNNWDGQRTPMIRDGAGWKASLSLSPGRYEYRFVVDGQWVSDPKARESATNEFGSTNSVLVI